MGVVVPPPPSPGAESFQVLPAARPQKYPLTENNYFGFSSSNVSMAVSLPEERGL